MKPAETIIGRAVETKMLKSGEASVGFLRSLANRKAYDNMMATIREACESTEETTCD